MQLVSRENSLVRLVILLHSIFGIAGIVKQLAESFTVCALCCYWAQRWENPLLVIDGKNTKDVSNYTVPVAQSMRRTAVHNKHVWSIRWITSWSFQQRGWATLLNNDISSQPFWRVKSGRVLAHHIVMYKNVVFEIWNILYVQNVQNRYQKGNVSTKKSQWKFDNLICL